MLLEERDPWPRESRSWSAAAAVESHEENRRPIFKAVLAEQVSHHRLDTTAGVHVG